MDTQPTVPAPSGFRIREIKTKTIDVEGVPTIVPELDEDGNEIELSSVDVPCHVEAEGADAIHAHVATVRGAAPAPAPTKRPRAPKE